MTTENQSNRTDVDKALLGHATYRSLGEQRLSAAEERFEKGRRTIGLFLAPLIAIVFLALPINMEPHQQTLAGVLLGVIVLWITEAVPIPIGGAPRRTRSSRSESRCHCGSSPASSR
jgi:solute carrier family 13 (sodium-dependent dicarboxylate transporter), member 2/3/5